MKNIWMVGRIKNEKKIDGWLKKISGKNGQLEG